MKVRASTAIATIVVACVSADNAPGYSNAPVSYTTVTIDTCETGVFESMITITNGITVTYCPECDMNGLPPTPMPTKQGPGYTTTYTTTYLSLCPTGMTTATYTVTESCTNEKPTWTPGPSHIPDGFTVTVKECTVCGEKTPTVTITEPCGCEATGGVPVPPKDTPIQQIPDGQVQNPKPGDIGSPKNYPPAPTQLACNGKDCGGSTNQSPNPVTGDESPPACNGEDCGGSGNQSPTKPSGGSGSPPSCNGGNCGGSGEQSPSGAKPGSMSPSPTTPAQCPGPACRAQATHVSASSDTGSVPYAGAASSMHFAIATSIVMAAVAVVAFTL